MTRGTVKQRIALWLTLLMLGLALLLAGFAMVISSTVATHTAMGQLERTLRGNLGQMSYSGGSLTTGAGFHYYSAGVTTLVYNPGGALLAGQLPLGFPAAEAFSNGATRTVSAGGQDYLVLDFWYAAGWEDGVWVRGVMPAPDTAQTARNLLLASLAALPVFLALAALGSYGIVKRAFRPLDRIAATASAINEGRDLSRRIGLPPGRDEFSRLAQTFDALLERLERSFEAEQQFASDASHELRTPVSIIKGACEYAQRYDETPAERQETLDMIYRQTLKMAQLIQQLLSMTRLEQGTEAVQPEPVELGELARAVCEETGCAAALDCPAPVTVQADPALLARLVRNLLENAVKYGRPGGQVWVEVRQAGREALLTVRDDGIGIPPAEQEKIWQRFYQVDPSRGEGSGAGLGLALVQQIARLHGGRMTLESAPGEGSAFTLHLPLDGAAQPAQKNRKKLR